MKIYKSPTCALLVSKYDENNNLILKLSNVVANDDGVSNRTIDFLETGLAPIDCFDEWTCAPTLSIGTDEAVPPFINDTPIGGNHGHPCAIEILHYGHGKTCRDIGSVWKDENGTLFYLVQVQNCDILTVVSQNVGKSKDQYQFVLKIAGNLSFVRNGQNKEPICPDDQVLKFLCPAVRHQNLDIFAVNGNQKQRVIRAVTADSVEIRETYNIINPATVGPALEKARPSDGFSYHPIISDFGEKMLYLDCKHCVLDDGTYLNDFYLERLTDVYLDNYMGVMCQTRRDFFGGGVFRFMPKTLPFTTEQGTFDFSNPKNLTSPFPTKHYLTKESWADKDNPPNRFVDLLRDKDGHNKMGYASGYLPLYDGAPELRSKNLNSAICIVSTRKLYPFFKDKNPKTAKGVAYKKYFKIEKDIAYSYSITYNGAKYIYCDFFAPDSLSIEVNGKVELLELSPLANYKVENGKIIVNSTSNTPQYAVFKEIL